MAETWEPSMAAPTPDWGGPEFDVHVCDLEGGTQSLSFLTLTLPWLDIVVSSILRPRSKREI